METNGLVLPIGGTPKKSGSRSKLEGDGKKKKGRRFREMMKKLRRRDSIEKPGRVDLGTKLTFPFSGPG